MKHGRPAEQVVIIGAGGHGSEICLYFRDWQRQGAAIELLGFIDDGRPKGKWGDTEILGGVDDLPQLLATRGNDPVYYLTATGGNDIRKQIAERIRGLGLKSFHPWQLFHPKAYLGVGSRIGEDVLVAPGAVLTSNVTVGSHSIINIKASLSHDCVVGDYANLNPGCTIAGSCVIGEGAYIGAGATIIQQIKVGRWSTVGAGAVVLNDVPDGATVVGVPARVVQTQPLKKAVGR